MNGTRSFHRERGSPWRWPAAVVLACALFLGGLVFTPDAWIRWFLGSGRSTSLNEGAPPRPWLVLVPPPQVEVTDPQLDEPDRRQPPPPRPAPPVADWWREGWRIRIAASAEVSPRPSPEDSARYFLATLGVPRELPDRARPDSVLAARLLLLGREESYRIDELKPYFEAMTRARAYADLYSRVADMYDNFLAQEIIVPD